MQSFMYQAGTSLQQEFEYFWDNISVKILIFFTFAFSFTPETIFGPKTGKGQTNQ